MNYNKCICRNITQSEYKILFHAFYNNRLKQIKMEIASNLTFPDLG